MWKLTIEDDEGKQTGLPLAHEEYALGRADSNAIRLTDRNVSRKHAILEKNDQGWVVKDLDSYNGTYVNGVRVVGEQHLRHGDLVQLGDYRLELIDEALTAASAGAGPAGRGTTLSPLHTRPNRLVMVVGPTPGAEFPLNQDRLMIGRSEDAQVSVNHSSVSRQHAELISLGGGRYEVIDKGSANGIRINGVELKRGLLEAGDALELGDVRLRFVGAGKIFRAGVDTTQQPVVPAAGLPPGQTGRTKTPRGSGGMGKILALMVLLVMLTAAGVYVLTRPPPDRGKGTEVEAVVEVPDADARALEQAKERFAQKDVNGAHESLQAISEDSTLREDSAFKEIEAAWADMMFAKEAEAATNDEKAKILTTIASTSSVDKDRRDKAIQLLEDLKAVDPALTAYTVTPVHHPPTYHPPSTPNTSAPPSPATTQTSASTATSKPTGDISQPGSMGSDSYAAQRRALEPKVWGGRATTEEIRLLRAICSHQGDRACRDRANAMLHQKKD